MMRQTVAACALLIAVACDAGEGTGATSGDCPVPPAINTVCADVEGLGVLELPIVRAQGTRIQAATDAPAGEREGMNLELAQGVGGAVQEGTARCGEEPILVDFGEDIGGADAGLWRADPDTGTCTITVDAAGVLGTDEVSGTFSAILTSADGGDQTRDIAGSFLATTPGNG